MELDPAHQPQRWLPSPVDLHDSLADLAQVAQLGISGCNGAGVASLEDGMVVFRSSNAFSRSVDAIQHHVGEGPSVEALELACTVVSGTIATGESRWPLFVERVRPVPIRSALSIPLMATDRVIGSLNLYAHRAHAFTAETIDAAERFARPVAASLVSARLLIGTVDACDFAGYDLVNRAAKETAVGIVMGRYGLSADDASAQLRTMALASGASVKATSERVVAGASGWPGTP